MSANTKPNRRHFLQAGSASLLTLSALEYKSLAAASANDKILVGFIGVGGMGSNRLRGFLRHDEVEAHSLCEVDSRRLNQAAEEVKKRRDRSPKTFGDFRRLLEQKDIDAVMIATPDHWHALPFVRACEAGKDVFVEKPLSYSVGEGRAMVNAMEKYKRVTQMGNHIHSGDNYRRVVELVRSGKLGKLTKVHVWKTSEKEAKGFPENTDPPKELDYNFWLGPAPKRPYNPNRCHFNFRYFWDYSGGTFIDFWCHITDVAYWALDLEAPHTVSAEGGRYYLHDNTETPDQIDLVYEYPDLTMTWSVHPNPPAGLEHIGGIGCAFIGKEATLVTNYSKHEVRVDGKKADDFPRPEQSIPSSPGHIREFLDCIKSREQPSCNVGYGHRLTKGGLLGNIAFRTGSRIVFDNEKERITNSYKAGKLLMRNYRNPWRL